jgi:outer membrane protein TolC
MSLKESIELAKKNNIQLQAEAEEVERAEYLYREVRGSLLPQINLNGSVQTSKTYMPDATQTGFSFNNVTSDGGLANTLDAFLLPGKTKEETSIAAQLKMEQLLFSGGKLINGIRVANKYRSLQKKNYELKEEELVFNVINSYNQLVLLNEVVKIKTEALNLAREHYARVQKLHENGLVSEYDLLRADLEISKMEPELEEVKNNYHVANCNFKTLIGVTDTSAFVPDDDIKKVELPDISLDESIRQGLEKRIELYLSGLNVEMLQVKYNAEKGNYLPNVLLTAEATKFTASGDYTVHKDDFGTLYQAGIVFQIPIFTGLSNNAKIHQAKHEVKKAELNKMYAEDMIRLEITNNWQNMNTAIKSLKVQENNVKTAEKGYQIAKSRYENHVGIQLEMLDAQGSKGNLCTSLISVELFGK